MQNVQQLALPDLVLPEAAPVPDQALEARHGCVIYVRVSTIAQEDGFSPEIQRQHGRALADRQGFAVVAVIEETASGQDVERPGLQRVTQLIETGRVGHVIAYAIDRISRETWQGLQLAWRCQKSGVRLWDAKIGRQRYHTDEDRLLVGVESIFAGYEHGKIVARMRAGKRQRSLQGHPTPRCPYGYRYVRDLARRKVDKGHWEICEEEAAIVREIFARYLAGWSLTQIATELTARQVTRSPYPGAPMGRDTAVWKRGPHRGTLYVYYRCRGRRVLGQTHAQTTRNAQRLDTAVWQVLTRLLTTPRLLQETLTVGQTADPRSADARAREAERTRLQAALATCGARQTYLVELASAQQEEIAAITQKLQALRAQQTQICADLARLETVGPEVAPTPWPTAADLVAVCARVASVLASHSLAEGRTLLKTLALTVVWHPEDRSIELWGTLPLLTPLPFAWDGATVHVPPSRRFVPGTPLLPPRAPDQPTPLALPFPPETPPAPPRRKHPGTDARQTTPKPAAELVGARTRR